MSQKVIIAADFDDSAEGLRASFTTYLKKRGWSIWHRFEDLWLATNVPSETTAQEIWEDLDNIVQGNVNILVFCLPIRTDAAGRVPPDAVGWLNQFWMNLNPPTDPVHELPESEGFRNSGHG